MVSNTKWKDCKSRKTFKKFNFYVIFTKKFYVSEIAAVDLSKIFFLKNAKKTCKLNNRDLNNDWIIYFVFDTYIPIVLYITYM